MAQQNLRQLPLRQQKPDDPTDIIPQLFQWRRTLRRQLDAPQATDEPLQGHFEKRLKDLTLVLEVQIESPPCNSRSLDDVPHTGCMIPLVREHLHGRA